MVRLSIILYLISTAATSRVGVKSGQNASTGRAGQFSPWQLSYKGLSCLAMDSVPFAGLSAHWPKCWAKAVEDAKDIGTTDNCKLCDVDFDGSKPEVMNGVLSNAGCSAKVTCAAARLGNSACYEGHGALSVSISAAQRKESPDLLCLPCPEGCNECYSIQSNIMSTTGTKDRQFKCITSPLGRAETGGEYCEPPKGFNCQKDKCVKRTCKGGLLKWGCNKKDYKATCDFPKSFDNIPVTFPGPEDYSLTVRSGENVQGMPPVLPYLSGEKQIEGETVGV